VRSAYDRGMTAPASPGLSARQLSTWRAFLRSHAQVMRRLEQDLLGQHDLPLASYDVLVHLSEAPDCRLRMTELADRVLLSRSGLTRLVDRLQREGLVERRPCPSDARGTLAVLTDAGRDRLREAWPTHLAGVRDRVVGRFDDAELAALGDLLGRLVDGGEAPVPTAGDPDESARAASRAALGKPRRSGR
jgi:DNA-binding MarR family transcriptional regulator